MKPSHLIAPLLALCGSGAWIYSQQAPLTDLEEQTRILQGRIAEVQAYRDKSTTPGRVGSPGGTKSKNDKYLLPDGSLNWKAIAEMTENNRNGMGQDMRLMMHLQKKMMEMTSEEIAENIATIRSLDISEDIRAGLESSLVMMLVQKDPEAALKLSSESLDKKHSQQSWQIKQAFGEWSKKDPASAMAWMDKQVADGKFVSKSLDPSDNPRLEFEARLMGSLFHDDPAAVRQRLNKFSDAEQVRILQDHGQWEKKGKVSNGYISLVREKVDGERAASLVGNAVTSRVRHEGLESATTAINDFNLNPEERKEAVQSAVDNFSRRYDGTDPEFEKIYSWVEKEDPERAAELTSRALTNQLNMGQEKMEETFQTAIKITEESGQPEIMEHFMKTSRSRGNLEQHLSHFQDETLKEQYRLLYESGAQNEGTE